MIIFDIETMPLDDATLQSLCPPFDPASVKVGNLKDQAKIDAKIEAARTEHESSFIERAALDATTGRVLAIGMLNTANGKRAILDATKPLLEETVLVRFWEKCLACRKSNHSMVGLNIFEFDLPFLVRRSWILGVPVPREVLPTGRWWDSMFVDLRDKFTLGQWQSKPAANFNAMAKAFGTSGKPVDENGEEINGKDFHKLWESDRDKAVAYLLSDLEQPAIWAEKMGII